MIKNKTCDSQKISSKLYLAINTKIMPRQTYNKLDKAKLWNSNGSKSRMGKGKDNVYDRHYKINNRTGSNFF